MELLRRLVTDDVIASAFTLIPSSHYYDHHHRVQQHRNLIIQYPTVIPLPNVQFTLAQIKAVTLIPCCVGPLSVIGSLIVVYRIFRFDRHDPNGSNRRVYQRLLLMLSFYDVFASLAIAFGSLPVPAETGLYGAHGNRATCTVQGFCIQVFWGAVIWYNAGLMTYFLLTIRYSWTDTYFANRLEGWIHIWSIVVPMTFGAVCLSYQVFNPLGLGTFCHIAPYPPVCGGPRFPCTRGFMATEFFRAFVMIPQFVVLSFLFIAIFLIFITVRNQAHRALRIVSNRENIMSQTKAVTYQSIWFGVVFFNTYVYVLIPAILVARIGPKASKAAYAFNLIAAFFFPMQGFLNCLLYLRPRYTRLKRDGNLSVWKAMKLAALGGPETFRSSVVSQRRRSSARLVRGSNPSLVYCAQMTTTTTATTTTNTEQRRRSSSVQSISRAADAIVGNSSSSNDNTHSEDDDSDSKRGEEANGNVKDVNPSGITEETQDGLKVGIIINNSNSSSDVNDDKLVVVDSSKSKDNVLAL